MIQRFWRHVEVPEEDAETEKGFNDSNIIILLTLWKLFH